VWSKRQQSGCSGLIKVVSVGFVVIRGVVSVVYFEVVQRRFNLPAVMVYEWMFIFGEMFCE
jgi:hypothetical protein